MSRGTGLVDTFKSANNPKAALFHVLFKVLACLCYIFAGWISDSFVLVFVLCTLLLAFDFWTTKNVSGRLLVGLRWWNDIAEDGSSQWRFESSSEDSVGRIDYRIFW